MKSLVENRGRWDAGFRSCCLSSNWAGSSAVHLYQGWVAQRKSMTCEVTRIQ